MDVTLTPELEKWVRGKVDSGLYPSSSEVVREALRLLHRLEASGDGAPLLRQDVKKGLDQIERGEALPFTTALLDEVKAEGRQRHGG